ncbi:unnamed protein product [Notodromas monacha]|uniref:Uncharacterized protein n=1 Tax=Notodromas monacha TaxID=399045 RepID=A0A7R9BKK1_9CRUS|nr:unnamed protein product [Notodromas monacha]CAG0916104.1 unnamed protein product [Notodromas monacha]
MLMGGGKRTPPECRLYLPSSRHASMGYPGVKFAAQIAFKSTCRAVMRLHSGAHQHVTAVDWIVPVVVVVVVVVVVAVVVGDDGEAMEIEKSIAPHAHTGEKFAATCNNSEDPQNKKKEKKRGLQGVKFKISIHWRGLFCRPGPSSSSSSSSSSLPVLTAAAPGNSRKSGGLMLLLFFFCSSPICKSDSRSMAENRPTNDNINCQEENHAGDSPDNQRDEGQHTLEVNESCYIGPKELRMKMPPLNSRMLIQKKSFSTPGPFIEGKTINGIMSCGGGSNASRTHGPFQLLRRRRNDTNHPKTSESWNSVIYDRWSNQLRPDTDDDSPICESDSRSMAENRPTNDNINFQEENHAGDSPDNQRDEGQHTLEVNESCYIGPKELRMKMPPLNSRMLIQKKSFSTPGPFIEGKTINGIMSCGGGSNASRTHGPFQLLRRRRNDTNHPKTSESWNSVIYDRWSNQLRPDTDDDVTQTGFLSWLSTLGLNDDPALVIMFCVLTVITLFLLLVYAYLILEKTVISQAMARKTVISQAMARSPTLTEQV